MEVSPCFIEGLDHFNFIVNIRISVETVLCLQ